MTAAWTGDYGLTLDIRLTDGQTHPVALYVLDTNSTARTMQIDVLDAATGATLDTQTVASFHDGQYLVWNLNGHVQIRFTNLANGLNAVLSGIFFGSR